MCKEPSMYKNFLVFLSLHFLLSDKAFGIIRDNQIRIDRTATVLITENTVDVAIGELAC